jgi:ATP-binding cassette, subfamily B, heavy metal transporter
MAVMAPTTTGAGTGAGTPALDPVDVVPHADRSLWSMMRELLPYMWPADRPDLRREVMLACVCLVAAKFVTIGMPILYKWATDALTGGGRVGADGTLPATAIVVVPVMLLLAYAMARVLMMVLNQLRDVLFVKAAQHAVRKLTTSTFTHLHELSLRFHLERRTGALSRIVERGNSAIDTIVRMGLMTSIPTALELFLICGLLWWSFGFVYVGIVLVMVVAYLWYTVKASDWRITIRREMNESDRDANGRAVDSLLNYETVKYFGNEKLEADRYDHSMARYERASIRTYYSLAVLNSGQAFIFTIGLTVSMILSAYAVADGRQTIGDFVLINAMLTQLYIPLNFMGMVYREIKQGMVDIETMFGLLDQKPEVQDRPGAPDVVIKDAAIRFDNVSFHYDPARPILKNVSFEVPAGKMVAIVGPSGAGKSTVSRILFRFYDVASGHVTIDGQDIRAVTQKSVRSAIGVVPQDTVLFNDTIRYNVMYGRPSATQQELEQAAQMAQIGDFIATLPQGWETQVGERGLKLSGGEKQRVAIARTILKGPPILMLDEATSALDSHTEKEIQDALDRVSANRTTLVIAHRLSTIVHADQIIVLQAGSIVERGTHAELMTADGLYASMWQRQRDAEAARAQLAEALQQEAKVLGVRG